MPSTGMRGSGGHHVPINHRATLRCCPSLPCCIGSTTRRTEPFLLCVIITLHLQVYATFSNVVVVRCHFKGSDTPEVRLCWPGDAVLGGSESGASAGAKLILLLACPMRALGASASATLGPFRQLPANPSLPLPRT